MRDDASVQGVRIFWAPVQAKRETALVSYSISKAWWWIDSSCLFSIAQAPPQLVTHNFAAPTPGTLALLHMRSRWFLILGSNLFSFVSVYNNAQYWVSSIKQRKVNILSQW